MNMYSITTDARDVFRCRQKTSLALLNNNYIYVKVIIGTYNIKYSLLALFGFRRERGNEKWKEKTFTR